jgi:hypothetical protein
MDLNGLIEQLLAVRTALDSCLAQGGQLVTESGGLSTNQSSLCLTPALQTKGVV